MIAISINQWNEKWKDDEVFKVYRREYKKRFGWIKARKIEQDTFYAWSEKARKEKAKCDSEAISLQDFSEWLEKIVLHYWAQFEGVTACLSFY